MQARPGRIIDDSVVTFPRPRTIEMSYDAGIRGASPSGCAN